LTRRLGRINLRPQTLRARWDLSPEARKAEKRLAIPDTVSASSPAKPLSPPATISSTPPKRPIVLPLVLRDFKAYLRQLQAADLWQIHDVPSLNRILREAEPIHPQYRRLLTALARYRAIVKAGGWETLGRRGRVRRLRIRRHSQRRQRRQRHSKARVLGLKVLALKRRLATEGYYANKKISTARRKALIRDPHIDRTLIDAVENFQATHGLLESHRLDRRFYAALNVPANERLAAILRGIAAWRKSAVGAHRLSIWVNIPDFHLEVYQGTKRLARYRVVVGRARGTVCDEETKRRVLRYATPIQDAELTHLIFAPYWYVTQTIKQKELDPERAKDSLFYEKNGYEVRRPGTRGESVRQLPGPGNSLGFVKFIFPNPYATFIHDTPQKSLFARRRRDFSHGCMRVDNAWSLAKVLLGAQRQWNETTFRTLYQDWQEMGKLHTLRKVWDSDLYDRLLEKAADLERQVDLRHPIAVHVGYRTVRVDDAGRVHFLPDLYGLDGGRADPRVGRRCVPETKLARRGFAEMPKLVSALQARANALGPSLFSARAIIHLLSPQKRRRQRWLVREVEKKLEGFTTRHANLAKSILEIHTALETTLAATGKRWRKRLIDRAVRLQRLLVALEAMTARAERDCDLAAKLGIKAGLKVAPTSAPKTPGGDPAGSSAP
ncbi:MAG: L,D-transpeptidase family protein, partial [Deltaproteobacteria bacterium]|nr:L,D-transpeptidase family protein [Deltaproteobacteria bacterium]